MAFFFLAAWTTLLWLASATGLDPTGLLSTITARQTIDLLSALGLPNSNWTGVTETNGPQKHTPAYILQGENRNLKLPSAAFEQVSDLLRRSPEFTLSAYIRQEIGNTGIILSFAHGFYRYFELESSGRRNEIRLHYTSRVDSKVHVETFHYKLADNLWHRITVSVSGSEVELFVDCNRLYKRLLRPGAPDRNFTDAKQLWLGQRNSLYHFKGAMQDFQLIAGPHGYLVVCPHLDSTCPTCGQFSLLENTVQELTRHLQELSERLLAAEGRIVRVEECDCPISCQSNGTVHADGATWQSGCELCACVHGEVKCRPVECPKLSCKYPVKKSGECCQSCLNQCLFYNAYFDHGETVSIKKCLECKCDDGNMFCNKTDPETMCPKLNCPAEKQFSVPDNCCKFCPDIDECQQEGGLEGHHCHQNSRCVNTPGSYICECLPGYRRIDTFNCAELDECSTGEHNCDINAECINTQGSYHCVCREGYTGDGYTCHPMCNQSCLNGGICKNPGICVCATGYTGRSCERDLDECATNTHRCTDASDCVNMIGWYYCKCKKGYQGPASDNNLGTLCQDINECEQEIHSCHPTAKCVNTEGSFGCKCPRTSSNCRLSCMFEQSEIAHGVTVSASEDPCTKCTCDYGVITCEKVPCNCSIVQRDDVDTCCPQCDVRQACKHQEITDVVLMHGERWSYQCRNCECLFGQIDCWDLQCPPLSCTKRVQSPDDCCPRCDDRCRTWNSTGLGGKDCTSLNQRYKSGAQIQDPRDPCISCECKDGSLCCSYNNNCGNNAIGFDGLVDVAKPPTPSTFVDDSTKKFFNDVRSSSDSKHVEFYRPFSASSRLANGLSDLSKRQIRAAVIDDGDIKKPVASSGKFNKGDANSEG